MEIRLYLKIFKNHFFKIWIDCRTCKYNPSYYDERFQTYKSIHDVPDNCIDLIYGSHSLEHVQNIDNFKEQVSRILKPNAILFWEVPNAKHPQSGSMNNRIDIPHTYYFFEEFFENWFDEVILIDSYNQSHGDGVIENWKSYQNKDGSVLRALGRAR
jgi:predicted SAM-dependent methyltransferase